MRVFQVFDTGASPLDEWNSVFVLAEDEGAALQASREAWNYDSVDCPQEELDLDFVVQEVLDPRLQDWIRSGLKK
jgi:hypothetical protein